MNAYQTPRVSHVLGESTGANHDAGQTAVVSVLEEVKDRRLVERGLRRVDAIVGRREWRARYKVPQDAFVASYSGNLGRKQGLDVLFDAARALSRTPWSTRPSVIILISGDGAMRPELEARFRTQPEPNLRLLPLLPEADYRGLMATSDICLVTQAKGTGRFFLPSKLLSILVAGRPVLAAADETSELALAIREGDFGVVVPPEDPAAIVQALSDLAVRPAELAKYGPRGLEWVGQFESNRVLGQFERRLLEISQFSRPATR